MRGGEVKLIILKRRCQFLLLYAMSWPQDKLYVYFPCQACCIGHGMSNGGLWGTKEGPKIGSEA